MFERTSRYRTIHSIDVYSLNQVIKLVRDYGTQRFLDYGCHLGHLSFELAMRFPLIVYAVDNFTGTVGDKRMEETIAAMTDGSGDFFHVFMEGLREFQDEFIGTVIPMRTLAFWDSPMFDFIFVDSSHKLEDAFEFRLLSDKLRVGGIFGGHDFSQSNSGVVVGVQSIEQDYEWLQRSNTFFMKKLK